MLRREVLERLSAADVKDRNPWNVLLVNVSIREIEAFSSTEALLLPKSYFR